MRLLEHHMCCAEALEWRPWHLTPGNELWTAVNISVNAGDHVL